MATTALLLSVTGAVRPAPAPGTATVAAAAARPVVQGNVLVDSRTGATWSPRGVNYPSFEYACAQGWGTSRSTAQGSAGSATAAAIGAWGANAVRLPLNQDCWNATGGVPSAYAGTPYRQAVQSFVTALNNAGLVVVLDLHSRRTGGPQVAGQRAMPDAASVTMWSSVAAAFAANPSVMFDAFNEPYSRWNDSTDAWTFQLTWSCWASGGCSPMVEDDYTTTLSGNTYTAAGMASIVAAVRAAGAEQPILLGGLDYANDLRGWLAARPDDDQLVASLHSYRGQRCSSTACWNGEIAPVAAVVPVVIGEFGATTSDAGTNATYLEALMDWADAHHVGYLAWAWWVLPDTSVGTLALLSADDGTPRAPAGTALRTHLLEVASQPTTPTTVTVTSTAVSTTTVTQPPAGGVGLHPLAPCRLVDTRVAGGILVPGMARTLTVGGSAGFPAQGGRSGGCAIPTGATAISVVLTAVGPTTAGYLRSRPTGTSATATVLSFPAGGSTGTGLVLPVAAGRPDAVVFETAGARTHVVIDVLGWFG
ncbi:cellulase family glycosylhydrolase [Nakamurella alba]|uniref:cellulase family glycosylhydrolase n=1 Tax=Nakamurella alba TaxID=2665158 RepID=UPI0012B8673C|nr:cellulase family glycosylhydrolase [Nakamurella alba]